MTGRRLETLQGNVNVTSVVHMLKSDLLWFCYQKGFTPVIKLDLFSLNLNGLGD